MKILILGAGQVGATLAEQLVSGEANDVVVIDSDRERLDSLCERADVRAIVGNAAHPDILEQAEAEDADMLIAVTGNDEVNIVASLVCRRLYDTKPTVVRLRSTAYRSGAAGELFADTHQVPIDERINPEQVVVDQFDQLLRHPGSLQVLDFANGLVKLTALRIAPQSPMVGHPLSALYQNLAGIDVKVVAIYRRHGNPMPNIETVLEENDEVFFVAAANDIDSIIRQLNGDVRSIRRVAIAGCGNIGTALAKRIESRYSVKVLEPHEGRASKAAETLNKATVIHANATNRELLEIELIGEFDVFCAVTNDDEVNFMSSVLAKQLGVPHAIALISNSAYADLVQIRDLLDVAISPKQAAASEILSLIRTGPVERVHSVRKGVAEAMMIRVQEGAFIKPVGEAVRNLPLGRRVIVGAVIRNNQAYIGQDDMLLENGDSVILFVPDKKEVRRVTRSFSLSPIYF